MSDLGDREKIVLHTIINEYIQNSEPVGSRNVSKIGPLRMSPATIRNIMGDLEEKGYLEQPHASSGRVPTDLGYRYYIDHLVRIDDELPVLDTEELQATLSFKPSNVPSMMKEFSKRLGMITNSIGFVAAGNHETETVRQIEFTRLTRGGAVLAIVITKTGLVKNVLLNVSPDITDSKLQYMGNYLTEQLANMNISELRAKLNSEFKNSVGEVRSIIATFMNIDESIFADELSASSFVLQGAMNVLNFPEFQDSQKLKTLLHTLDEKQALSELLERSMDTKGVQIFIGSEMGVKDIDELGLVTSAYEKDNRVVGMLGVIGPKRMQYSKVISVVNYSSHLLAQMFNELYGGKSGAE